MSLNTSLILFMFLFGCTFAGNLPVLHQINTHTFNHTYQGTYDSSALFLSDYSVGRGSPDLLYSGYPSQPFFMASTSGDDFSLLSLIGNYPLENLTAARAFNYANIGGQDNTFKANQPAFLDMAYSVLLAKSSIRALFAFRILSLNNMTGECTIEYAVLSYSIQSTVAESPSWGWETPNTIPSAGTPSTINFPLAQPLSQTALLIAVGVMSAIILGLLITVIVLGVQRRRMAGYTHIQS